MWKMVSVLLFTDIQGLISFANTTMNIMKIRETEENSKTEGGWGKSSNEHYKLRKIYFFSHYLTLNPRYLVLAWRVPVETHTCSNR